MLNIKNQISKIKNSKIKKFRNIFLFFVFLFTLCFLIPAFMLGASTCFAEDIKFEATVDKNTVSLGSNVQLSLRFEGTQSVEAPNLSNIDGFNWQYLGPATNVSIINGNVSTSIIHNYILVPLKVGTFQIPSLSFDYQGKTYSSQPITIEVVQSSVSHPLPQLQNHQGQANTQGLEDRLFLIMQPEKRKAYVNEMIPLKIKLYVNRLAVRDIQYPVFQHEGFAIDKFAEPKQYQDVLNGVSYDVIEFTTNIFGTRPDELILGPAELKCNLMVKRQSGRRQSIFGDDFFNSDFFEDFFGRYEANPLTLKSVSLPVTILPLPAENIPEGYDGAMGSYNFSVEAEPREVKVGDPITLKMNISGTGNFKTVNQPKINFRDNFKAYDPEVKQGETNKIFEQVIIPKSETLTEVPEITFSFFDTNTGEYKKIARGPIPIKVNPLPKGEELKILEAPEENTDLARKKEILGRDIIYIKDTIGKVKRKGEFLCKNKLFITIQFIPILLIVIALIFYKRRVRFETDVRYARRLRAPGKARKNLNLAIKFLNAKEGDRFFDIVFKTLQEYLADKFHLPSAGITANIVEEELKPRGIGKDMLDKIRECFNNCDTARYVPSTITPEQMKRTFELLKEIIDELEGMKL